MSQLSYPNESSHINENESLTITDDTMVVVNTGIVVQLFDDLFVRVVDIVVRDLADQLGVFQDHFGSGCSRVFSL